MDFRLAPAFVSIYFGAWLITTYPNPSQVALTAGVIAVFSFAYCALAKKWLLTNPIAQQTRMSPSEGLLGGMDDPGITTRHSKRQRASFANLKRPEMTVWLAAHLALISTALSVMSAGMAWRQQLTEPLQMAIAQSETLKLSGRVVSEPIPAKFGNGYLWELQVANSGRLKVTSVKVPYRAIVAVEGKLEPLQYFDRSDKALGKISASEIEVVAPPALFWRLTNTLRESLGHVCATLSPQAAGLVPGMAIGDISRLPPLLKEAFQKSGLSHLTAVSGSHFAIILTAVVWLLGGLRPARWLRIVTVAVISLWFVALVRPAGAVLRAAAVCVIALLGTGLGRKAAGIPALCAGGLVLLMLDPWLARSYGFALSYASSAALLLFTAPLAAKLTPWFGDKVAFLIAVPTVAWAGSAPILVLLSQSVTPVAVLANLAALPAVGPATLLSLAATVAAPISPAFATVLARLAAIFTGYLAAVASFFAGLPGAAIPWLAGARGALALAAVLIGIGLVLSRWKPRGWPLLWRQFMRDLRQKLPSRIRASKRRFGFGIPNRKDWQLLVGAGLVIGALLFSVSMGSAVALFQARATSVPSDWAVAFCDVGQGDALVMQASAQSAVVVDVGPDDAAINRCLTELGVKRVELLVLSHFHADHVAGLRGAIAGRQVSAALLPSYCDENTGVLDLLQDKTAEVLVPAVRQHGQAGKVAWQLINENIENTQPCRANTETKGYESPDLNDKSLVIRLTSGDTEIDVIALGDLEVAGQEQLLRILRMQQDRYGHANPIEIFHDDPIEIVKVAHHGSAKQSYELARLLKPQAAVFSVGADNTFGHPTARALEMYQAVGATNVRTDQCGTAVFSSRNGALTLTCLASTK